MVKVKYTQKATRRKAKPSSSASATVPAVRRQTKPKAKSRNQLSNCKSQGSESQKRSDSSMTTSFQERTVSAKQSGRWCLLKHPTKTFVTSLIDSCIDKVLSITSSSSHTDVKETLDVLRQRLVQKLQTSKGPPNVHGDYSKIQREGTKLKKMCAELAGEAETLEEAIETQERLASVTREKLKRLEITCDSSKVRKTLFQNEENERPGLEYPDYSTIELMQEKD